MCTKGKCLREYMEKEKKIKNQPGHIYIVYMVSQICQIQTIKWFGYILRQGESLIANQD